MSEPWYHDPRMLAAGNARRRPAGESDLAQPGSAKAMPIPPGRPITASTDVQPQMLGPDASPAFTAALIAEARAVGLDPLDLARLYAKAYARTQPPQHRKPSLIVRLFTRKG